MQRAKEKFPISSFEKRVLMYLESLQTELPKPDLQQVEEGKIDGLSEEESREMLARMDISA